MTTMIDEDLVHTLLKEIDRMSRSGIVPITSNMLDQVGHGADVLSHLIAMKGGRIISGDVVAERATGTPRKITSIRLTYTGMRMLKDGLEKAGQPATLGK